MLQIRLIGLVLFVTAVLLAFAAAITKTSHVRVKRPDSWQSADAIPTQDAALPMSVDGTSVNDAISAEDRSTVDDFAAGQATPWNEASVGSPSSVEFISIPIIWPLLVAGGMGMVLWFVPAPLQSKPRRGRSRGRRRRKRRR